MNTNKTKIKLPLGWNALLNHSAKKAILCGEYKVEGDADTSLELLNKNSREELIASIDAMGYEVLIPKRPTKAPTAG